jgi:leucyl-tRNA synthetase
MASELLEQLLQKPLYLAAWPSYDPVMLIEDKVAMVVQVNGKLRGNITVKRGLPDDEVEDAAQEVVLKWLEGKQIVKVIVVPGKLVNFVIK